MTKIDLCNTINHQTYAIESSATQIASVIANTVTNIASRAILALHLISIGVLTFNAHKIFSVSQILASIPFAHLNKLIVPKIQMRIHSYKIDAMEYRALRINNAILNTAKRKTRFVLHSQFKIQPKQFSRA
ncbi:hypothetical protein FGO68_gene11580 [Halteria grandinella]|uniref:Uncharacterized protein n=1 Tax=Halteria grandinella TaxID=5974 RepID=A0A8J8P1V8_HALGN|nr:hypothetical protein FGO68_gene11580 [Halteria grandinella]